MSEGDILHYILILDAGVAPTISLVSTGDIANSEEAPDAVVALDASDITTSSFTANWHLIENASAYYLDVATDSAFTSFVAGYNNLSVGYVKEYPVVGLTDAYTYYYRVRGANHIGTGDSSNTITTTTANEVVTDFDGNIYTYVTIGTQQWMVENFRSTHYDDGTAIPLISDIDDWYLPSKDELNQMYVNLKLNGIGDFSGDFYWASSENNATTAWTQYFTNGFQNPHNKHDAGPRSARACRNFISSSIYSLGDYGEAGWVFYSVNNGDGTFTYYEAAPFDHASALFTDWSNITALAIGTTGTAIGTGQQNTLDIIGQVGHTDSVAKFCDDVTSNSLWVADTDGACCAYDNNVANIPDYGLLYNWYAVDNAHGLAPAGWRVPSEADINTLITFIGGNTVAGGILKDIGLTYWQSPNTGALNTFGFTAKGSGQRIYTDGSFIELNQNFNMHSSDDVELGLRLFYDDISSSDTSNIDSQESGWAVRMMRDV